MSLPGMPTWLSTQQKWTDLRWTEQPILNFANKGMQRRKRQEGKGRPRVSKNSNRRQAGRRRCLRTKSICRMQLSGKKTSLKREEKLEVGIREEDGKARTNRRFRAISINMDPIGMCKKMGREMGMKDTGRSIRFLRGWEDRGAQRERWGLIHGGVEGT